VDKNWGDYLKIDKLGPEMEGKEQFFQTFWETEHSVEDVQQFYQVFFENSGWEISSPMRSDYVSLWGISDNTLVAIRFGQDFTSMGLPSVDEGTESTDPIDLSEPVEGDRINLAEKTQYALLYVVFGAATDNEPSITPNFDGESLVFPDSGSQLEGSSNDHSSALDDSVASHSDNADLETTEQGESDIGAEDGSGSESVENGVINDINEAPDILEAYVKEFVELGIVAQKIHNQQSRLFRPNEIITRRDYARWLFLANNLFYRDRPSQMLRESDQNADPIFQDILSTDPDFGIIQGLAEAGLITSTLIDPEASVWFRPSDALTRENLIAWKSPLDTRNPLPDITVDEIEETWGFRDATLIDPSVLSAIWIDSQNGDAANIRRVFGYTRLFQPNKTVTRAEAASVLWSFGSQSEVRTAASILNDKSGDNRDVRDNESNVF